MSFSAIPVPITASRRLPSVLLPSLLLHPALPPRLALVSLPLPPPSPLPQKVDQVIQTPASEQVVYSDSTLEKLKFVVT